MKGKIFRKGITRRLFSVVLALAMVLTLMPDLGMEVYASEPMEGMCKICNHIAEHHVMMSPDEGAVVMDCMACTENGMECQCRDKTWAECTGGGYPTKLNGLDVTWPEGCMWMPDPEHDGAGIVLCWHGQDIYHASEEVGLLITRNETIIPIGESELTAGTYNVCDQGCQVILGDAGSDADWVEVNQGDKRFWYNPTYVTMNDAGDDKRYECNEHRDWSGRVVWNEPSSMWQEWIPCDHFTTTNPNSVVTITNFDVPKGPGMNNSFTKKGITVTAQHIGSEGELNEGGTFTTSEGNFTRIELNMAREDLGSGWVMNQEEHKTVWTGNANSVPFENSISSPEGWSITFTLNYDPGITLEDVLDSIVGSYTDSTGYNWTIDQSGKIVYTTSIGRVYELSAQSVSVDTNKVTIVVDGFHTFTLNFLLEDGIAQYVEVSGDRYDRAIPHTHGSWDYSADGATLTAECKAAGECELTEGKVSLTLLASEENYSGISGLSEFNTATGRTGADAISESDVKFYTVTTEGATTGGTNETSTAPTADGYYYASLTVGGATAVKAFTIGTPGGSGSTEEVLLTTITCSTRRGNPAYSTADIVTFSSDRGNNNQWSGTSSDPFKFLFNGVPSKFGVMEVTANSGSTITKVEFVTTQGTITDTAEPFKLYVKKEDGSGYYYISLAEDYSDSTGWDEGPEGIGSDAGIKVSEVKVYGSIHTCSNGVEQNGQAATCTADGFKDYYKCGGCDKFYEEAACTTEINNLETWKTTEGQGKIAALGHAWGYNADGATLTATCSRDGSHTATLTLTASSPNYSGSAVTCGDATVDSNDIKITGYNAWNTAVGSYPEVKFSSDGGANWSSDEPTNVGDYKIKIYPNGEESNNTNTITSDFSIESPIKVTKPNGSKATYGEDYEVSLYQGGTVTLKKDNLIVSAGDGNNLVECRLCIGNDSNTVGSFTLKNLYLNGEIEINGDTTVLNIQGTNQIGTAETRSSFGLAFFGPQSINVIGEGRLTIYDGMMGIKSFDNADLTFDTGFTGTLTIDEEIAEVEGPPACAINIGTGTLTVNNGTLNLKSDKQNGITAGTININGGTVIAQGGTQAMSVAPRLGSGVKVEKASVNLDGSEPVATYVAGDIDSYKYLKIVKTHTWSYSANGATLTATCNKGCGASTAHTATLTLTASSANYSGNAATITIGNTDERTAWEGAELTVPTTIVYETAEGAALTSAPTEAGSYVAKVSPVGVTASETNTAKVSFTISDPAPATQITISSEEYLYDANIIKIDGRSLVCDICGETIAVLDEEEDFWTACPDAMDACLSDGHIMVKPAHKHSFTYTLATTTAANDTIKATCGNATDCDLTTEDKSVTVTLTATSETYSGSAISKATLFAGVDFEAFNDATELNLSTADICIYAATDADKASSLESINAAGAYVAVLTVDTATATLAFEVGMESIIEITTQPKAVTATEGKYAAFKVAATGTGLTYQWQYSQDNGKTWRNSEAASGATAEYSLKATASRNGYLIRCIVKDTNGKTETSEAVKLTVKPVGPVITTQPEAVTATEGKYAAFKVAATGTGLTYQWQYSQDNGKTWRNSEAASGATAEYSLKAIASRNGYLIRCIVTDAYEQAVTSGVVKFTVKPVGPEITTQPEAVTATEGTNAIFKVTATGTGLTYQWQYSQNEGKTWRNSAAASGVTAEYSLKAIASRNGYLIRCIVTDANEQAVTSEAVKFTVKPVGPVITTQPEAVTATEGKYAAFKVAATGTGLTYQWQYSQDKGKTWRNSGATSGTTDAYSLKAIASRNGYLIRCIVTDANEQEEISEVVQLTVKPVGPEITTQPEAVTAKEGKYATFKIAATGTGLTYQWQYSQDNGATWVNSGAASGKTAEYSLSALARRNGYLIRCIVTDANEQEEISEVVQLTVTK